MNNEELDLMIDKSLKSSEEFHLPVDFAQKVTVAVIRHEQWKSDIREYLSILGIIVTLLAVAGGLYYYIDKGFVDNLTAFVTNNLSQVIVVIFLLNFILLADRVLLPLLFNRWSRQ